MHLEHDKFRAALGGAAVSCGNDPPAPPAATAEIERRPGRNPRHPCKLPLPSRSRSWPRIRR